MHTEMTAGIGLFSFREDATEGSVRSVADKLDTLGADYHFVASEDIVRGLATISLSSPFAAPGYINNAWVRKISPGLVLYPDKPLNDPLNLRAREESFDLIKEYIAQRYRGLVVCDPNKAGPAENKITQLRVATETGLEIPRTIFTNSVDDARVYFGDQPVVYKAISQSMPITDFYGREADNPTTPIILADLPGELIISPSVFQESIVKKAEYRVTVVGQEMFIAKLTAVGRYTETDWRDALLKDEVRLEPGDLPEAYKQKLYRLVESMGLNYASLDVIEDLDGNLYFIDLNPSGNFGWVEHYTGLDISGAIANLLAGRTSARKV